MESNSNIGGISIDVDGYEILHLVWYEYANYGGSGSDIDVFYRFLNQSTGNWSSIQVVSSGLNLNSGNPKIVSDDIGNLYIAWAQEVETFIGNVPDIYYRSYNATSHTWSASVDISNSDLYYSNYPDIDIDGLNKVHIVWEQSGNFQNSGADDDIFCRHLDLNSGIWSDLELVTNESVNCSNEPAIDAEISGKLHLVWREYTDYLDSGDDWDIYYKNYSYNVPQIINIINPENKCYTIHNIEIIVSNNSNVDKVWCRYKRINSDWTENLSLTYNSTHWIRLLNSLNEFCERVSEQSRRSKLSAAKRMDCGTILTPGIRAG